MDELSSYDKTKSDILNEGLGELLLLVQLIYYHKRKLPASTLQSSSKPSTFPHERALFWKTEKTNLRVKSWNLHYWHRRTLSGCSNSMAKFQNPMTIFAQYIFKIVSHHPKMVHNRDLMDILKPDINDFI